MGRSVIHPRHCPKSFKISIFYIFQGIKGPHQCLPSRFPNSWNIIQYGMYLIFTANLLVVPPLVIEKKHIDEMIEVLQKVL